MWKKNCFSVARGSEPCLGLTSGWEGGQMFLGSNLAERPRKVTLEAGNSTTVPMGHSALMPGHWGGGHPGLGHSRPGIQSRDTPVEVQKLANENKMSREFLSWLSGTGTPSSLS